MLKQICNCDKSRFPTDRQKCKAVSIKWEVPYKVTPGTPGMQCSQKSNGPTIIFKGKNYQSSWTGNKGLPDIFFSLSESGGITSDIFAVWFAKFCDTKKERPLVLLFDRHLTHVFVTVLEWVMEEKILILSTIFLPHVTDVLQLLDVAYFRPLKKEWQLINLWVNKFGANQSMGKDIFVNIISEILYNGLKNQISKVDLMQLESFPLTQQITLRKDLIINS